MLSIAHVVTGSFIATKVGNPLIAIPIIFASHYLEDWIPHWDVGTGLSSGKRKKGDAIKMEFGDLALSAILVIVFWQLGSSGVPWAAYWGGAVALLPDFMEAPRNFWKWEPQWLKPFNTFHGYFHHSIPNKLLGLIPQVIVLVVIYLLK